MDEKQARFDLQLKQYEQEQAKLKQLGYTLERMKGWGINNRTLYRRAMSIQHRMERIQKTEKPKKERTMKASFGERDFSGDVVFKMKNVAKSFGLRQLFSDINLNVEAGERIALLGDNGTGKSTFIKCLLGQEDFQGKIQFGPTVKWGYLPQIIHFDHPERTLYDTMLYEKNCSPQVARDRLGAFMFQGEEFQGEDVFKTVGNLSGGEQSRLRLCMLMDEKINLLILDEPTNHLDIASREWVEAAIEEFEGVLLFVSHDRYFIEKFAERIWLLEDGTIRDFPCGYQKYRSILEHEAAAKPVVQAQPKPKKEKPKGGTKDQEKLVRRLEREIEKQEAVLAEFDTKIEAAGADYQELTRLLEEKEQQEQEKLVRRLEREIEKQEAVLAEFDTKIEAAGADYQELTRLLEEKEQQEQILLELMEQWEIEKQEAVLAEFDTKIEAAGADYQELTRLLEEKEQQEQILLELMEQWEEAQQ